MNRKYSTKLLSISIAILITQIASFVFQNNYGNSLLTIGQALDVIVLISIAFMLLLQFKKFDKVVSIILVVYGGLNIVYGLTSSLAFRLVIQNRDIEVLFTTGLLIAHVLFEIAALFNLVHNTQTKFETKFTKNLTLITLSVSFVLLAAVSPFVTYGDMFSVLKTIAALLAILALYASVFLGIEEKAVKVDPVEAPKVVTSLNESKLTELEKLYNRGIITEEEYQTRKERIESQM
ncbi:SHOCT domain-containing protein [Acholeplasma equirhinis]|uniref:SHOCT domain-containing protein n=1 Tax=Acholeplasma equirhinis TaxID=555393 RepID=UPI00197AB8AF|nr:SHOCT domain-containing protein [Acholeplasma equirhinis]MBN3491216.1 SHOCT domain-containing protein [Acholeplasma equirhinis]